MIKYNGYDYFTKKDFEPVTIDKNLIHKYY
jgi:hypothetical protein